MSTPTESTPTYLDQLPDAIINIISDYVVCEANWNTGYSWLNSAACIGSLHKSWPHSRYEALTEPYMQHGISLNGSAFNLKQIMDALLLGELETTLSTQFLVFAYVKFMLHEQKPFESFEEEDDWLTAACTNLGLDVEDMELDVIWPYKRFELLVQLLDKVTKFCYSTDAHRDSPFATIDKKDVALESQWQHNNMISEPAFSTSITPVPSALRSVDQFYMGHGYWHNVICENPYQTLLPVFFLPNIRVIQCSNIFRSSVVDEDVTSLALYTPPAYTSPVTTLRFTLCDVQLETFEKFLGFPKALVEFSFRNCTHGGYGCTMGDMVQLLSNYHSKSLEILTLDGTEKSQKIGTVWSDKGDDISPRRIGSLNDFKTLRVIEAPIWSLVDCSDPQTLISNLPEVLPQSLEKIKFFVDITLDKCPQQYLEIINWHLECMIEKKRKKYPRLAIVEVYTRYIARNEGPDWDCLYEDFKDSLAGLAMKENVRLNIH